MIFSVLLSKISIKYNDIYICIIWQVSGRAISKIVVNIPLFRRLVYEITHGEVKRHTSELPALQNSKQLPSDELLFLHQIDRFKKVGESLGREYVKSIVYRNTAYF